MTERYPFPTPCLSFDTDYENFFVSLAETKVKLQQFCNAAFETARGLNRFLKLLRQFELIKFIGIDLSAHYDRALALFARELDDVKNSFSAEGSLHGALGYYRDLEFKAPPFLKVKTEVPTLVIAGVDDGTTPLDAFEDTSAFAAPTRLEKLPTGHFPHRERPDLVLPLLLEFLAPQV